MGGWLLASTTVKQLLIIDPKKDAKSNNICVALLSQSMTKSCNIGFDEHLNDFLGIILALMGNLLVLHFILFSRFLGLESKIVLAI